jgi:hypothetical protein
MGAVNFSIDVSLVETLKRELPLEVFVETGTFKGDGVSKVRGLFQELYTVESSAEYYEGACERFKSDPAIHIFHDTSPTLLRTMMPRLANRSVLYWLDAHCCGDELTSNVPQCPLLEELAAIGRLNERSVLLIDDARLFLAPPPPPHNPEQWPSLDLVIHGLHSLSAGHEILVLNDVIVYFPLSIAQSIRAFAGRCSVDWLTALDKARDYDDVLSKFRQLEQDARQEIQNLVSHAAEKDVQIQRQHADIMRLLQEMSDLRRSSSYRLGFALLNPWTSINQKLLRKS